MVIQPFVEVNNDALALSSFVYEQLITYFLLAFRIQKPQNYRYNTEIPPILPRGTKIASPKSLYD